MKRRWLHAQPHHRRDKPSFRASQYSNTAIYHKPRSSHIIFCIYCCFHSASQPYCCYHLPSLRIKPIRWCISIFRIGTLSAGLRVQILLKPCSLFRPLPLATPHGPGATPPPALRSALATVANRTPGPNIIPLCEYFKRLASGQSAAMTSPPGVPFRLPSSFL